MSNVTFITGNQGKADFFAKHMNRQIPHRKLDLDEIQSLDLAEVAEHKARQAFGITGSPVLVEDVSLVFEALGKLPGPFIKWFEISLGLEGVCELLDGRANRKAFSRVCFVYFDGTEPVFFKGELSGSIAEKPKGDAGFGFDPIFIPDGSNNRTTAEYSEAELGRKSLRTSTVYPQLKKFLDELDNK